jgi:short-subunit dehydrogenase
MAAHAASKQAIEGYSESLDHEVRGYGIRALLVEPAYTGTGFEATSPRPEAPVAVNGDQRRAFDRCCRQPSRAATTPPSWPR